MNVLLANWRYLLLAVAFFAGWAVNEWRLDASFQVERNAWAQAEQDRKDKERLESDNRALELWAADQREEQKRLADEKKLADFERCIADGSGCGLRVRIKAATCPSVPAGQAAGVGARTVETAQLDDSVGPDYRALRSGIQRLEAALKVCVSGQ